MCHINNLDQRSKSHMNRKYKVFIGNRGWMTRNNIKVSKLTDHELKSQEVLGRTAVIIAMDG